MKITSIVLGLALSTAALADGVSFDRSGTSASLTGTLNSTSSEVFEFVARAYEHGYKDAQGADFFNKTTKKEGMRSYTAFKNKNVSTSLDSAFAVIYKVELKGQAGDILVDDARKSVTIKNEPARILMGALSTVVGIDRNGPVGVGRVQTKSGKIVCS
nr:hypothetical protein [Bdellovibrionales bacterium]